uniref:Uncharacterized protein n=1 Tax=viral metagenome TaxID=1070528 RepID=A0A6M3LA99_9ZZZZ
MPYGMKKFKSGYQVIKKSSGKVVAGKKKPLDYEGAKGFIWHAGKGEKASA